MSYFLLVLGPIKSLVALSACLPALCVSHVAASWTKLNMYCKNLLAVEARCAPLPDASIGGSVLGWTFAFGKLVASFALLFIVSSLTTPVPFYHLFS